MLSFKENFLRALSGEVPEYIPQYNIFWTVRPSIFMGDRVKGVGKDIFGVEWTAEGSAVEAALPKPGDFILEDIRKWRDIIKFPDFSGVDWETMAQRDLAEVDPEMPRGGGSAAGGFFQAVMSFMGFTEGLIACSEEPEEVRALCEYLCDCYLSLADKMLYYYKPEYVSFGDDIAHERNPFVSLDTFRAIFAPVLRRYIQYFKDRGYLAVHHNCGKFDAFVDDIVDMGFNAWEPAQVSNDLVGIKKKYGNKLMIGGGFDSWSFLPHIDVSEEEIRALVKKTFDELAPGGGYAFLATGGTLDANPVSRQRWVWVFDEFEKLKFTYY